MPTGQTAGEGFLAEGITGHGQQGVGRAGGRVGQQGDQNCPDDKYLLDKWPG